MKTSDKTFDELIRSSLGKEEAEYYQKLEKEDSFVEEMQGIYSGKRKWLSYLALVYTFAFFGLAIFSVVKFFDANETKDLIFWATLFLWSALCMAILKFWNWIEMNKNLVIKETKKLELQVSILVKELSKSK